MIDKQIIEEMTKELREIQPLFYASIAEQLYNAGYRKIPENAVVLTREEYDGLVEWQSDTEEIIKCKIKPFENKIYELKAELEKTRKETAEKFAGRVKMAFYYHFDELIPSIMADKIDEICKEISEGKVNE